MDCPKCGSQTIAAKDTQAYFCQSCRMWMTKNADGKLIKIEDKGTPVYLPDRRCHKCNDILSKKVGAYRCDNCERTWSVQNLQAMDDTRSAHFWILAIVLTLGAFAGMKTDPAMTIGAMLALCTLFICRGLDRIWRKP